MLRNEEGDSCKKNEEGDNEIRWISKGKKASIQVSISKIR